MRIFWSLLAVCLCAADLSAQTISAPEDYADWPSAVIDSSGTGTVVWTAYDGQAADLVKLRHGAGDQPGPIENVTPRAGDYFKPIAVAASDRSLWVTWAGREGGNIDIYARRYADGRTSSASPTIPSPTFTTAS